MHGETLQDLVESGGLNLAFRTAERFPAQRPARCRLEERTIDIKFDIKCDGNVCGHDYTGVQTIAVRKTGRR